MKKLLVALSFYTRIPINIKTEVTEDEFYGALPLLPIIGLIIGAVLYVGAYGAVYLNLSQEIIAFGILLLYIWFTGGLHIDGYIDAMDALLSNRDREKMLEIMKDSRIGAFGALAMIMLLLGYFIIFKHTQLEGFLLMPIVGRSCGIFAASLSKYAKETNDLGKRFIEDMNNKHGFLSILFSVVIIVIVNMYYLIPFLITLGMSYYYVVVFKKKLNGMTGDTIGMLIELNQVVFLFVAYIIGNFIGGIV